MNSSPPSQYAHLGQTGPLLQITPGRNCRLYPYIQGKGCTQAINQCKSDIVYKLPGGSLQGYQPKFDYTLAGSAPCSSAEGYCSYCTNSTHQGGCRCNYNDANMCGSYQ